VTNQQGEHTTNASPLVTSKGAGPDVPSAGSSAEVCPTCKELQNALQISELARSSLEREILAMSPAFASDNLRQQLAEKDREIERLRKMLMGDNEGALLVSDLTESCQSMQRDRDRALRAQKQAEERLSLAERERDEALGKLQHLAKVVAISERITDGQSDAEIEAMATFNEAMAQTVLEETEKELAEVKEERDMHCRIAAESIFRSSQAERDAARYQWLRNHGLIHFKWESFTSDTSDVGLDHAVDEGIKALQPQSAPGATPQNEPRSELPC
jgi:hypothetical protein